jgi:ubiquinone/menaquinone biosynthesis C-methylase UbiE
MLDRARELAVAEGVGNASFLQGDAQAHPFEPNKVDVAISRFGSMFLADPIAAVTNIGHARAVGGRRSTVARRS